MKPGFVIPVMDIKNGEVARAVAGNRGEYKPVQSPLLSGADPLHFVNRFTAKFNFKLFYIADLDAIMGRGSNIRIIEKLLGSTTVDYWLDAGYKTMDDVSPHPRLTPVIATETFQMTDVTADLSKAIVSIDTMRGKPIGVNRSATTTELIDRARAVGARRFIFMRLDAVGCGNFDVTALPRPEKGEAWYSAGGIRSSLDLDKLSDTGYSGALVSTALHNGALR
ncbi:Phosphoribosylformimino-5-aminoimidazole carboxamide ribotide isomerase related protein [hydrothermal vent metagenome]|uniref:Phosphoribosylformimino-5-aminoimidazole carboxamide ribotide isomerase related protein n=1 Tax=hydrothermal vent metagenome TaxID=652676 RepID=A0A3B1BY84_9ZZZZ